jgi:hypothetical protein
MKYSLRSLMIVVTLVCVVLGGVAGRIEYLRQAAAFHERERNRYFEESLKFSPTIPEEQRGFVFSIYVKLSEEEEEESSRLFSLARYHHVLFERYKQAVWRPWTIVDESQPPP